MKKGNGFIIAAAAGTAVYFLFPQVQEILVGGEYSGAGAANGGTSGFINSDGSDGLKATTSDGTIVEGVLSKKQLNFITSNLDTSLGESSLNTYSFDGGATASILSTNVGNERSLTSPESFGLFGNTNTLFTYKKDGKIVGGSDFKNMQSVTAERARSSSGSKDNVQKFVSGSTFSNLTSSKKSASISTAKDSVVRDYENKNLVSTTKTSSEIKKENKIKSLFSGGFN